MPYMPRALFALVSYMPGASCTFCSTYFHISHALLRYVPLVPHALRPLYVNNTFSAPFSYASNDFFMFISNSLAFLRNLKQFK